MSVLSPNGLSPTSHRYFSQRLRMHFVEWGSRQAPTIVLVHGVRDHCRTWDDLVGRLSRHGDYHFVARICAVMVTPIGCRGRAIVISIIFMTSSNSSNRMI